MNLIAIIVGCLAGIGMGFLIPTIPYTASNYLAIGIVAAMDTVIGGFASNLKGTFDIKVFVTGFLAATVAVNNICPDALSSTSEGISRSLVEQAATIATTISRSDAIALYRFMVFMA